MVCAAMKLDVSVRPVTSHIAGLVENRTGLSGKRIGYKFLSRLNWPVQISPRDARASNVKFTDRARRYGL